MQRPIVAILASGEGTTAEAFIRASASGRVMPQVGLVICSNPKAGILRRVQALNAELGLHIETSLISSRTHPPEPAEHVKPGEQTPAEEAAMLEVLQNGNFDLIALMGYMKKVGPRLVHEFGWRPEYTDPRQAKMVNTHPGLLPETKSFYGIHVQEHVLERGLPSSGQTLHVVAKDYDDGPVIAEHKIAVEPGDTPERLFDRVREVEKKYLPGDIDRFIKSRQEFLKQERG